MAFHFRVSECQSCNGARVHVGAEKVSGEEKIGRSAVIQQEYAYWWPVNTWHVVNAPAPNTKHALKKLVARFNAHGTLQDRRKKRKAGREGADTVCTQANIDMVSEGSC